MKKQIPVFSSLNLGEFYSTPDVEDEIAIPSFSLDSAPVKPGTVRMKLTFARDTYALRDDGHGQLLARVPRSVRDWLTRAPVREVAFGTIDYENGIVHLGTPISVDYQYDVDPEEIKNPLADLSLEFPEKFRPEFRKLIRGQKPSEEFMELLDTDEDAMAVVEKATDILCACFGFPRENKLKKRKGS